MRKILWLLLPAVAVIVAVLLVILPKEPEADATPTPTKTPALPKAAVTAFPSSEQEVQSNREPSVVIDDDTPSPMAPLGTSTPVVIDHIDLTLSPSSSLSPTQSPSPMQPVATKSAPTYTATPVPTFTPPPKDTATSDAWDHYWLERPIPPGYTNWVVRIYPYGSTLGGTLPTHHGVEFFNPVGVPVVAAGSGVAVTAGADAEVIFGPHANFYGNLVVIRHDQTYDGRYLYSLYGHLSEVGVEEGHMVAAGQEIGLVGGTGVANGGAHLHFEVRVGENRYEMTRNPDLWIRPFWGWGTIAGQITWPDGSLVYEAPLVIQRIDDPNRFIPRTIYSYADDSVNPDDRWRENFTSPDLEPGPYEVVLRTDEVLRREMVWVYPNQTSFVTISLGDSSSP